MKALLFNKFKNIWMYKDNILDYDYKLFHYFFYIETLEEKTIQSCYHIVPRPCKWGFLCVDSTVLSFLKLFGHMALWAGS